MLSLVYFVISQTRELLPIDGQVTTASECTIVHSGVLAENGCSNVLSSGVSGVAVACGNERALQASMRQEKIAVRESLITLVVIVTSYLCCNFCFVLLTILEYNAHPLVVDVETGHQTVAQIIIADTITFLYMFCSSVRICMYAACNHHMRDALHAGARHLTTHLCDNRDTAGERASMMQEALHESDTLLVHSDR